MDERDVVKAAKEFRGRVESALGEDVAPAARHAMNRVADATKGAAETASDFTDDVIREGGAMSRRAARSLERNVEQSPVAALAIIAVASFALGYALRASTKN